MLKNQNVYLLFFVRKVLQIGIAICCPWKYCNSKFSSGIQK